MQNDELKNSVKRAHEYCFENKEQLLKSDKCGCFYCLKIFDPKLITEWCDNGKTAFCPFCGIDSVIYDSKEYPVNETFLEAMQKFWF